MNLVIEFSDPYTRTQIRAALSDRATSLPVGAVTIVRPVPLEVDVDDTPDVEADTISTLKISGFTLLSEVATFLSSLPETINSRISRVTYT